ncbi:MAG: hypothetical protein LCH32_02390 [Bacteroidetes bacterium]|nr:hypothetical protein [Bacteroidota bacterium]
MKKIVFSFFIISTFYLSAQSEKAWRIGLQWGAQDNHNKWSGGMDDAHARFHENKYPAGAFDLIARYDHNKHWMATFGMGVNTYGFNFGISNNYKFSQIQNRWSGANAKFTELQTPILIHYKFNPNCKNNKWVIGAGFVPTFAKAQTVTSKYTVYADGAIKAPDIELTAKNTSGPNAMLRFVIAREHEFKKGGILHAAWIFNAGLNNKAKAYVNYTLDNTNYYHEFTNTGNFVGFRLAYWFKPYCPNKKVK